MLLNFFVLGLVPGTHIQITFQWFLILGIIADVIFGAYFLLGILWLPKQNAVEQKKTANAVN